MYMAHTWWIVLLICCSFALSIPVAAVEPPALAWNTTLGGSWDDIAFAGQQTSDGGYIIAGRTGSSQSGDVELTHGMDDAWVVKLDDAGQIVWTAALGGNRDDQASAMQQTSDGGYIVAGYTTSNQSGDVGLNHGKADYWVVKLDDAGQIVWTATLGGSGSEYAYAVDQTNDGGYVVAGYTASSESDDVGLNHGMDDAWVVKLDGTGQIVWTKILGGGGQDYARAVQQTSDEGYVVAGYTYSIGGDVGLNHGGCDYWVVKLDGSGEIVWTEILGGSGQDYARAVQQTSDGGYVVAGYTASSESDDVGLNHGMDDAWVVKLDGAGKSIWNTTLGGGANDHARAVQQTTDGGYVVTGYTTSNQSGDVGLNHGSYVSDYWVVKLDGAGKIVWTATLGGSGYEEANAVQQTSDGGYIVTGYTTSNQSGDVGINHGKADYWVVKLDGAPIVQQMPGAAGLPTDTDGDGKYDDVNGNNRADFADVVLYFNQMAWISGNEPAGFFDYNGNGRIDFADVVWLFNHL